MSRCEKKFFRKRFSKTASVIGLCGAKNKSSRDENPGPSCCKFLDLSYMRQEVGKGLDASGSGSPAQGRILRVGTRRRVGGAGVISGSGGGGAGQVDRSPKHEVAHMTHRVENLQRQLQTSLGMKTGDKEKQQENNLKHI